MNLPRAVVLGVSHPRDATIIRSLGKAGIPVDVVDHLNPPTAMWRASRFIRHRSLISKDDKEALTALEALGKEQGGLLIPTNEPYVQLVSRNYDRLSTYFTIPVPPWKILGPLMDRERCLPLAHEAGLETPRAFTPSSFDELKDIISQLDFDKHDYIVRMKMWTTGPADIRTRRRTVAAGPSSE